MDDDPRFTPPGYKKGMDGGHLVARMFGGSNTKSENFVPLYPNSNQIQMKATENEVAARVNRGETVLRGHSHLLFPHRCQMYIPSAVHICAYSASGVIDQTVANR